MALLFRSVALILALTPAALGACGPGRANGGGASGESGSAGMASGGTPGSSGATAGGTGGSGSGTGAAAVAAEAGSGGGADGGAGSGGTPSADASAGEGGVDADAGQEAGTAPEVAPAGCVNDVTAGEHILDCDGITYKVSVPESCLSSRCGLIVDVHGGTMNGQMEDNNTGLSELGRQHGYVVIHPNAVLGLWNAAADDARVLSLMQDVRQAWDLDPKRIHMTGLSQGGYMTWRFICQHTDLLASAAPAAAAGAANISIEVGCTFAGSDLPQGEVDVLYMHGTKDALVNFPNAIELRDAVIAHLAMGDEQIVSGDDTYTRTRYTNANGTIFDFVQHEYAASMPILVGHCFPGSPETTLEPGQLMAFACLPPNSFYWGQMVIDFFMTHPKR